MGELDNAAHEEYQAATQGCVLFEEAGRGVFELRGRDRADLLHRITTNDVNSLAAGQGMQTLWLNRQGRILEVLTLYATPDILFLVTEQGQEKSVYERLDQSIFFGDEIQVEDVTAETKLLHLYGPECHEVLSNLGMALPATWPLYHHHRFRIGGVECVVGRGPSLCNGGFALRFPGDGLAQVREELVARGVVGLSTTAYDVLRVEHGYPSFGSELNETVIPLEAGLRDQINFSKGCYVGQEVITRMDSRQRMARQLCSLRLSGPVSAPTKLLADDKDAGVLTSAVVSPCFGAIGLGFVRTGWSQPGQMLGLASSNASAEVVALPFRNSS